jgi:hypothetical protein
MKCDDFLPLLATGGRFGRWRARRHARHCSGCAAAAQMMGELTGDRSRSVPLPAHLRQSWQAVVPDEFRSAAYHSAAYDSAVHRSAVHRSAVHRSIATRRTRSHARLRWVYAAAALAAFALLALPPLIVRRWNEQAPAPPVAKQVAPEKRGPQHGQPQPDTDNALAPAKRDPGEIALTVIEPDEQLAWLEQHVVQLAGNVEQVATASQKLAAEQEINELLRRHAKW